MNASRDLPSAADVVVVGGGIIGASIAMHLAETRDVVLLEARHVGAGASGRSAGMVRQHYSHPTLAAWAVEALGTFRRLDGQYGFQPAPYLMVCGEEDAESLEGNVALQREAGVDTRRLSPDRVRELVPGIEVSDVAAAAYEPGAGYADPVRATTAFADAAQRRGVRLLEYCPATRLERDADGIRAVRTAAGPLPTRAVVLAAGSGARELALGVGLELPLRNLLHRIAVFDVGQRAPAQAITVSDRITGITSRPAGSTQRLVGATDVGEGIWDVTAAEDQADEAVVASYAERLRHRLPGIASTTPARSHAGIYHMTPDGQPILGPVAGIDGLFLAVGFCHGFKLAPVIGRVLASCIRSGIESTPEIREFDHARFERGALIHPRFPYEKAYAG